MEPSSRFLLENQVADRILGTHLWLEARWTWCFSSTGAALFVSRGRTSFDEAINFAQHRVRQYQEAARMMFFIYSRSSLFPNRASEVHQARNNSFSFIITDWKGGKEHLARHMRGAFYVTADLSSPKRKGARLSV